MQDRLTKEDWLAEGLRTLVAEGVGGLKVGTMSNRLGVSRGSFYWHFADIVELRVRLLDHWRETATEQVIRRVEHDPANRRFQVLLGRAFAADRRLERAVRAWALIAPEVREAVAEVDARRVAYIAGLLTATGSDPQIAVARARFAYWAYLGQPQVMHPDQATATPGEIGDIADLLVDTPQDLPDG